MKLEEIMQSSELINSMLTNYKEHILILQQTTIKIQVLQSLLSELEDKKLEISKDIVNKFDGFDRLYNSYQYIAEQFPEKFKDLSVEDGMKQVFNKIQNDNTN